MLASLDAFTRAYLIAALWTWDDNAPSGAYETSGRIEELLPQFSAASVKTAIYDCGRFQRDNEKELAAYYNERNEDSAGHDFWLTRNHHGTGFWDRAYEMTDETAKAACEALTKASQQFGEIDLDRIEKELFFSNEGEHVLKSAGLHYTQTGDRTFSR